MNDELNIAITDLQEQVKRKQKAHLELNQLKKNMKMLNSDSSDLDSIMATQRRSGKRKGIGFQGSSSQTNTKFVKANGKL